jgi:nucleoside-diphosphate-sugar epimerase
VLNKLESMNDKYDELLLFEKKDIDKNNDWIKRIQELVSISDVIFHIGADSNTMNYDVNEMLFYNYYFSKVLFDFVGGSNKKVIYSSSAACYGENGLPENIYGWSKYLAEQYGSSKVKNFIGLRYFNVYGPGEDRKGKMSSIAFQALTDSSKTFKLFPGQPKRDFVYIEDVVDANISSMHPDTPSGIFDVGSGVQSEFEEIMYFINREFEYLSESSIPKNYQFSTLADKKKFLPSWCPKFNLEDGLVAYKEALQ